MRTILVGKTVEQSEFATAASQPFPLLTAENFCIYLPSTGSMHLFHGRFQSARSPGEATVALSRLVALHQAAAVRQNSGPGRDHRSPKISGRRSPEGAVGVWKPLQSPGSQLRIIEPDFSLPPLPTNNETSALSPSPLGNSQLGN